MGTPINNEQLLNDVITLLDGFNEEFAGNNTRWSIMTREEKVEWFDRFAVEHAHYMGVDEEWMEQVVVH